MNYILTLYQNYGRGVLPYAGSLSEQPSIIIEIFSVLHELNREREQIANESLKRGRQSN